MRRLVQISFIVLFVAIGFYSCTTENVIPIVQEPSSTQTVEIRQLSATIPDFNNVFESTTRTVIDDSNPSDLQLVWNDNDTIGIYPDQGFQVAFPMASGSGTKSASFDGGGWGLKNSSTYSA